MSAATSLTAEWTNAMEDSQNLARVPQQLKKNVEQFPSLPILTQLYKGLRLSENCTFFHLPLVGWALKNLMSMSLFLLFSKKHTFPKQNAFRLK